MEKPSSASLGITDETVQVHLKNIFAKLNVSDRTAVNVVLKRGMIQLKQGQRSTLIV